MFWKYDNLQPLLDLKCKLKTELQERNSSIQIWRSAKKHLDFFFFGHQCIIFSHFLCKYLELEIFTYSCSKAIKSKYKFIFVNFNPFTKSFSKSWFLLSNSLYLTLLKLIGKIIRPFQNYLHFHRPKLYCYANLITFLNQNLWGQNSRNMTSDKLLTASLFIIKSLGINSNKIHFSNCKLVVSHPKFIFIALDNLYMRNSKHK